MTPVPHSRTRGRRPVRETEVWKTLLKLLFCLMEDRLDKLHPFSLRALLSGVLTSELQGSARCHQ